MGEENKCPTSIGGDRKKYKKSMKLPSVMLGMHSKHICRWRLGIQYNEVHRTNPFIYFQTPLHLPPSLAFVAANIFRSFPASPRRHHISYRKLSSRCFRDFKNELFFYYWIFQRHRLFFLSVFTLLICFLCYRSVPLQGRCGDVSTVCSCVLHSAMAVTK